MPRFIAPVMAALFIMGGSTLFGTILMDSLQVNYPKTKEAIDRKITEIIDRL